MVVQEILTTRHCKLCKSMRHLKQIAAKSRDENLSFDVDRALTVHYLRLALGIVLDVGNHIIATEGFRKPLLLREIPEILLGNGIIAEKLANKISMASGLRNRLVHV